MTRRIRRLHPDERALWSRVAATTRPIHAETTRPSDRLAEESTEAGPKPKRRTTPEIALPRIGSGAPMPAPAHDLARSPAERLAQAPLRMDDKAHKAMIRGRLRPEARLDLHGMTLTEAHPALIGFVLSCQSRGLRLILVITGKGRPGGDDGPIPQRQGVLRHQVPLWLAQPPLGGAVQQVVAAHLRHGGTGAYYVYLRRRA